MKTYTHLTTDERVILMLMRGQGSSLRSIGDHLGRHPSSLSRELRRNRENHHYGVVHACALARDRLSKARRTSRLLPGSELFQVVTEMLKSRWSPQQITARLKLQWPDSPEFHVSHESIYLAFYAYPRPDCFAILTSSPIMPLAIRRKKKHYANNCSHSVSSLEEWMPCFSHKSISPRMVTRCVALAAGRFDHNGLRPRSA
jgi:IS30 family transposase